MNKLKDINFGDFLSFKASDGFYRVLFCSSVQKSRSPYYFNFSATTIKAKEKPTINDIRNSKYYGKGNRNGYKFENNELEKIWDLHPEIKPNYLGTYELLITRKNFMSFRDKFELISNLPILKNLNKNGNGGMNASELNILDNFFVNRIEKFMTEQNQEEYLTEAILKLDYKKESTYWQQWL
ncbi:hypothetical protein [uncultured Aquimarina sp.]|uniref:hypothetical protein n=1 Tax=uncultured Aquimarina sp. TaxID=575652 RepID=UPI002609EE2E|nr:hypothetical protein [uncultured Aquimarina sp.]